MYTFITFPTKVQYIPELINSTFIITTNKILNCNLYSTHLCMLFDLDIMVENATLNMIHWEYSQQCHYAIIKKCSLLMWILLSFGCRYCWFKCLFVCYVKIRSVSWNMVNKTKRIIFVMLFIFFKESNIFYGLCFIFLTLLVWFCYIKLTPNY